MDIFGESPVLTVSGQRVRKLLQNQISVLAYHLPLDCIRVRQLLFSINYLDRKAYRWRKWAFVVNTFGTRSNN